MVIFEFYAKNAAEWWPRELGSRSLNLFPSVRPLVRFFCAENEIFFNERVKKLVSEALVVIFEFYAKNAAEWWPRELGSRSVNLFPSVRPLVRSSHFFLDPPLGLKGGNLGFRKMAIQRGGTRRGP